MHGIYMTKTARQPDRKTEQKIVHACNLETDEKIGFSKSNE